MASFDMTNGGRLSARMKYVGYIVDGFEIQFRIDPGGGAEKIMRHKKISRIVVSDTFGRHLPLRSGFLNATNERLTFVVSPMTNFVS